MSNDQSSSLDDALTVPDAETKNQQPKSEQDTGVQVGDSNSNNSPAESVDAGSSKTTDSTEQDKEAIKEQRKLAKHQKATERREKVEAVKKQFSDKLNATKASLIPHKRKILIGTGSVLALGIGATVILSSGLLDQTSNEFAFEEAKTFSSSNELTQKNQLTSQPSEDWLQQTPQKLESANISHESQNALNNTKDVANHNTVEIYASSGVINNNASGGFEAQITAQKPIAKLSPDASYPSTNPYAENEYTQIMSAISALNSFKDTQTQLNLSITQKLGDIEDKISRLDVALATMSAASVSAEEVSQISRRLERLGGSVDGVSRNVEYLQNGVGAIRDKVTSLQATSQLQVSGLKQTTQELRSDLEANANAINALSEKLSNNTWLADEPSRIKYNNGVSISNGIGNGEPEKIYNNSTNVVERKADRIINNLYLVEYIEGKATIEDQNGDLYVIQVDDDGVFVDGEFLGETLGYVVDYISSTERNSAYLLTSENFIITIKGGSING